MAADAGLWQDAFFCQFRLTLSSPEYLRRRVHVSAPTQPTRSNLARHRGCQRGARHSYGLHAVRRVSRFSR
jgi:hypothetical protein